MVNQIKKLNDSALGRVQALESRLGCCVVALENQAAPAGLSDSQVGELQKLEKEIGAVLVAYNCDGRG
jgi:hypothetical protein